MNNDSSVQNLLIGKVPQPIFDINKFDSLPITPLLRPSHTDQPHIDNTTNTKVYLQAVNKISSLLIKIKNKQ